MINPYISIEDALVLLDNPTTLLFDCTWFLDGRDAFELFKEGHIPGARFLDMETVAADLNVRNTGRHPLPSVDAYCRALSRLGVSNGATVILYDTDAGTIAARIWWMNSQLSIPTYIIEGGIQSYKGQLEVGDTHFKETKFVSGVEKWENTLDTDELVKMLSSSSKTIIFDARNQDRYRGTFEPVDSRAGHIPGAINLPTRSLMKENYKPLSQLEFQKRLLDLIGEAEFESICSGESRVVVSCGSGITACHLSIFFEEATGSRPILYNGSFSAWANRRELPIETGDERGTFRVE